MRIRAIPSLISVISFMSATTLAFAENRTYGNVTLQGLSINGPNAGATSAQGMVCNVNGPDGFLTIRGGPGSNYASQRKLNRLAILTINPAGRQGKWVPILTAMRTHSKDGYSIGAQKSLHVTGWAHGNYICDFTAQSPYTTSFQQAPSQPPQTVVIEQPPTVVVVPPAEPDPATTARVGENAAEIQELQEELDALTEELALLREVRALQEERAKGDSNSSASDTTISGDPFAQLKIKVIDGRITTLSAQADTVAEESKTRFLTPIRPKNASTRTTARKLAELFPKVPFYRNATTEIGELRIRPFVTDAGDQLFELAFVDVTSRSEQRIEEFNLTTDQIQIIARALEKSYEWSETALKNQVRDFRKTVDCITQNECEDRQSGKASTQVDFRAYADGSTGAVIIRNKGGSYSSEFSLSVESALLLAAYSDFIWTAATDEFKAETRSTEEVDSLFQ